MSTRVTVRDLGEKRIIAEIIRPLCGKTVVPIGIGDDAAMLAVPAGKNVVVSTDKIPEDLLAIQLGLMDVYHHGRYLATVNISDIAAMGGDPAGLVVLWLFLMTFPSPILQIYTGVWLMAARNGISLSLVEIWVGQALSVCLLRHWDLWTQSNASLERTLKLAIMYL